MLEHKDFPNEYFSITNEWKVTKLEGVTAIWKRNGDVMRRYEGVRIFNLIAYAISFILMFVFIFMNNTNLVILNGFVATMNLILYLDNTNRKIERIQAYRDGYTQWRRDEENLEETKLYGTTLGDYEEV